jgi:hypothetical protein
MGKRTLIIFVLVLLLAGGTAWAWRFLRTTPPDPLVAKIKQMQEEVANLPPDKQREQFEAMRKEMEGLPREERRQLFQDGFRNMMQKRISDYCALPADQKTAYLDKQIEEMERRRLEGGSRRGGPGGPGGGGPGGPGGLGGGDQTSGGTSAAASQTGQDKGQGGPGSGQRPSAQQRLQFRKQMLDNGTPQQRAQTAVYINDMNQRRSDLGLPPMPTRRMPF